MASGTIQFAASGLLLPETVQRANISVVRLGGHSGSVIAEIALKFNNTSCTVIWEDGDMSPKLIAIELQMLHDDFNDSFHLDIKVAIPLESKGEKGQHMELMSERLFGVVKRSIVDFSSNHVLTISEPSTNSDECLFYASRVVGLRNRAHIDVRSVPCDLPFVGALEGTDFNVFPRQKGSIVWEPGEYDTRCLVRNLQQVPTGLAGDVDAFSVFLWPDGLREGIESICFKHSLESLTDSDFVPGVEGLGTYGTSDSLVISVSDSPNELSRNSICKRGSMCLVDFKWAYLQPTDIVFSSFTSCPENCSNYNNTASIRANELPWNVAHLNDVSLLIPVVFCGCRASFTNARARTLGSLIVEGPTQYNKARCQMGIPTCSVALDTISPSEDETIRIMSHCDDNSTTPPAFVEGAKAKISNTSASQAFYLLENPVVMWQADPGIYSICWCRKSDRNDCKSVEDYNFSVGTFLYVGPYNLGNLEATIENSWVLTGVAGIGLTRNSRVRVMKECGNPYEDFAHLEATTSADARRYYFEGVDNNVVKAGTYHLCWCQPTPNSNCVGAKDFAEQLGTVTFRCPYGYTTDLNGDCNACSIWRRADANTNVCQVDELNASLLVFSLIFGMLGVAVFAGQLDCRRSSQKRFCRYRLQGRSIPLIDVSKQDDGAFVTTHGRHYLLRDRASLAVIFIKTGHISLDTTIDSKRKFHVVVVGSQRLQLICADKSPVSFRPDSSMGFIVLRPLDAVVHTGIYPYFPAHLFIVSCLIGVLIARLVIFSGARALLWQLAPMSASDVIGGLLLKCAWSLHKAPTGLQTALKVYDARLSSWIAMPKRSDPGPSRAVTAFQLFDLHDFFQEFIRDRTMYYIDPHITRPLTAAYKLSYAERAGPHDVKWFCSHYWGTEFRHFCETIHRHATSAIQSANNALYVPNYKSVDDSWKESSYWICTFSNNQYKLDEELGGGDHKRSSFYLALHSSTCRGTCMIFDEFALPLTRSWCLFELLQTIQVKKRRADFLGLLFCTSTGVLNYGAASVSVSLNIGEKVASLRLEDAQASTEQDKEMIHSLVRAEMGDFNKINQELRGAIKDALYVCKEHVEAQFETIMSELSSTQGGELSGGTSLSSPV